MSEALSMYLYADEPAAVNNLLAALPWDEARAARVGRQARDIVERVRKTKRKLGEIESFLTEYGLNTEEGLALMTLAEALLRIPDAHTANMLIRDKMAAADWIGKQIDSGDFLIKAAGFGLSLTRKTLDSAVSRLGEPVIRQAMLQAMRMLGKQFVLGRTIDEALKNAREYEKKGYRLSYDMLGEGARTAEDAERYFEHYKQALAAVAATANGKARPGISVKLSALHPRYHFSQKDICVPELTERLDVLARAAAEKNISLTVDAEEVDRLELSLEIVGNVARNRQLNGWEGFGLAVQAYQKRALPLIRHMAELAGEAGRRMQVRLVKGAYWDAEVKRAQIMGLPDYPVFTRKANTDLSYLACAHDMLRRRDVFYPMFATHNAHSVAAIMELAGNERGGFEFQRLHGMGETLHDIVLDGGLAEVCVYAPCGSHEELLPYLVRRLLENGASTSFVYKILDARTPIEAIVADPVADARAHTTKRHTKIPLPHNLFGPVRCNSSGLDLTERTIVHPLLSAMEKTIDGKIFEAAPLIAGALIKDGAAQDVVNPADTGRTVGKVWVADESLVDRAFAAAKKGFAAWSQTPAQTRAATLDRLADLMEEHCAELMALCVHEAGKTVDDALAEVREAVDFCRYYAQRGRVDFDGAGIKLPGPTGESNALTLHGRGAFVCISPWNFPLAIFMGQIAAALMAGNAVIAKPAEQTPLIAARAAQLILSAGVPPEAFTLMTGDGKIGAALVGHPEMAGVAFTGSTEVARLINRALAAKDGPIVPLIAETGGQNAMIVDSSALTEQVVDDVLVSAFGSAGQRCSALRVLFLQDDIADKTIAMLAGAMKQRRAGDPWLLSSDIGPVIDDEALKTLEAHRKKLETFGKLIAEIPLDPAAKDKGTFFAPVAYEIDDMARLEREVFGPILHVIRFKAENVDRIIEKINASGYGLTFGMHTRIESALRRATGRVWAGNAYVNRTMTGAVVGVQPFGGQGLSGTGPKAGGPHYLHRFAVERVLSINTTASGGNASLVTMEE